MLFHLMPCWVYKAICCCASILSLHPIMCYVYLATGSDPSVVVVAAGGSSGPPGGVGSRARRLGRI